MANPITTIISPTNDRILTYFVNQKNSQLALSQFPLDQGRVRLQYQDNGTPKGSFATNNCIAAVYVRDMPVVYGLVNSGDDTSKTPLIVSQLSPITNLVLSPSSKAAAQTDLVGLDAVSDGMDTVWCYFLKRTAPDSAQAQLWVIKQVNDVGNIARVTTANPASGSRLAAIYLPGGNHVFYQKLASRDNSLYYVNLTTQETVSEQVLDGTKNAAPSTPLACVQGDDGTSYLYWMSSQGELQRATRVDKGKWVISSEKLYGFPLLLEESQISVTQTKNATGQRTNHVYYLDDTAPDYQDHIDELTS